MTIRNSATSELEEFVFVGGARDGLRMHVQGESISVPQRVPESYVLAHFKQDDVAISLDHYVRERIHILDAPDVEFFRLATITPHEALSILLSGYRRSGP